MLYTKGIQTVNSFRMYEYSNSYTIENDCEMHSNSLVMVWPMYTSGICLLQVTTVVFGEVSEDSFNNSRTH